MELLFLGTGAADWDINAYRPDTFFRRFSAALVNDDLLIDPGPHIFHYAETTGHPSLFDHAQNVIVTHTHGDHFCPETVKRLCMDQECILWGDASCRRILEKEFGKDAERIRFAETRVRTAYRIGRYTVTPLRSNHATDDPEETTRLYLIGDGERLLYYGCDSAWIPTESWNIIKDQPINAMVLECTCGALAKNDWRIFEHNTIEMLSLMLETFRKYGYFSSDVRFYTSHMARTLHEDHASLCKALSPLGVTPAYDGLTIHI